MSGLRFVSLLACCAVSAWAADDPRYDEIRRLIRANTIRAVRGRISAGDIPVLVRMMGDKDYGVASAASGLLVTLGKAAVAALDALRGLKACYDPSRRDVVSTDVCPADRAGG